MNITMNSFLFHMLDVLGKGLSQINTEDDMPIIKTKYYPYTASKSHGMEAIEYSSQSDASLNKNGKIVDSVFFKTYNDDGVLATPTKYPLGLTGFDYRIDADGKDKDTIPEWFFEFKIVDKDGDFTGQRLEIDTDKGNAYKAMNLYVDPITGDLVGINPKGGVVYIDGTFNADGTELTYRIDNDVLQDVGNYAGTVTGKFGWEHFGDNGASSYGQVDLY